MLSFTERAAQPLSGSSALITYAWTHRLADMQAPSLSGPKSAPVLYLVRSCRESILE